MAIHSPRRSPKGAVEFVRGFARQNSTLPLKRMRMRTHSDALSSIAAGADSLGPAASKGSSGICPRLCAAEFHAPAQTDAGDRN